MPDYLPVPVEAAKRIADEFRKNIVIILSWSKEHGHLHTTTFGVSPEEKQWAAQGGEIASRALGSVVNKSTTFEDYRITEGRDLLKILKEIESNSSILPGDLMFQKRVRSAITNGERFFGAA